MSFFKQYETALAVSRYGGISQAAEALGMAQPTLSKYLKKLESDLGAELFDRTVSPIALTPAGALFLESGKQILDIENQFQKQLGELLANKNTVIRVGISPSRSPYMMPRILREYRRLHPDCRVVIEERTTAELNNRLSDGELDLVLSLESDETQNFVSVPLFEETLLLAVPNLPQNKKITATDALSSIPLINVGQGQAMWQTVTAITDAIGIRHPDIECQSIESGLAMVKQGLGAMIVPSYIRDFGSSSQNESVLFLSFSSEERNAFRVSMDRRVCLFHRTRQFLTQAEKDFTDCIKCVAYDIKTGKGELT